MKKVIMLVRLCLVRGTNEDCLTPEKAVVFHRPPSWINLAPLYTIKHYHGRIHLSTHFTHTILRSFMLHRTFPLHGTHRPWIRTSWLIRWNPQYAYPYYNSRTLDDGSWLWYLHTRVQDKIGSICTVDRLEAWFDSKSDRCGECV